MPTVLPAGVVPWPLIGTAIDYRLRYYFDGMSSRHTVAACAVYLAGDPETLAVRVDRAEAFHSNLEAFVKSKRPAGRLLDAPDEALLNRYCLVLAHFDIAARSGSYADSVPFPRLGRWAEAWDTDPTPLLALAESAWVDDLCKLSRGFFEQHRNLLRGTAVLNPTFAGSLDVGGADADLIVDGCLIDIKATIDPGPRSRVLYQLLGYILLDYDDRFGVQSPGVYLARQLTLRRWPLDELLSTLTGGGAVSLARLRDAFRDRVSG